MPLESDAITSSERAPRAARREFSVLPATLGALASRVAISAALVFALTGCVSDITIKVLRAPVPSAPSASAATPSGSIAVVVGDIDNYGPDYVTPETWGNAAAQEIARTGVFAKVYPPGAAGAEVADVRLVVDAHLDDSMDFFGFLGGMLKAIAVGVTFSLLDSALPQRCDCDAEVTWTVTGRGGTQTLKSSAAIEVAWHMGSSSAATFGRVEDTLRGLTIPDLAGQLRDIHMQSSPSVPNNAMGG